MYLKTLATTSKTCTALMLEFPEDYKPELVHGLSVVSEMARNEVQRGQNMIMIIPLYVGAMKMNLSHHIRCDSPTFFLQVTGSTDHSRLP